MSSMFGAHYRARTIKTLGAISAAALLFAGLAAGSAQAATITFESDGFILAAPGEGIGFSGLPFAVALGLLPDLPQLPAGAGAAMDGAGPYEVIGGLRYDIDVDDPDPSQVRSWLLDIRLAGCQPRKQQAGDAAVPVFFTIYGHVRRFALCSGSFTIRIFHRSLLAC